MEREVFQRRVILFDKLQEFGFVREGTDYVCERAIYEGMIARIIITPQGEVSGKVFDADFEEEYVNHRQEDASGAFVVGLRHAYLAFLEEIAQAVTVPKLYIGAQANRVNEYIFERYGVSPEFMWSKFPHYGVYRNQSNRKWFAIIMNIDKGKVDPSLQGETEVMNLKLDDRAGEYIEKGAYPSYHMNHKSWVSIILDETLSDEVLKEMLDVSFSVIENTSRKKK